MKKLNPNIVTDYFLVLGSIIGVGFASGKEMCIFFFDFANLSFLSLIFFGITYIFLFFIVRYINKKLKANSYNEFNSKLFKNFCKLSTLVLFINFIITSAGMLAGAEYLFHEFLKINPYVIRPILIVCTTIILLGGIHFVKVISNILVPILLAIIVLNSIKNLTPQNVTFDIVEVNWVMAMFYGVLFAVNNFVTALPITFKTRLNFKGESFISIIVCLVILLNILVLASNKFTTGMPLLEISTKVSSSFYYIYLITLFFALFTTLAISSYNAFEIVTSKLSKKISAFITTGSSYAISNLGYNFIVSKLYIVAGAISALYVIIIVIIFFKQCVLAKLKMVKN